MELWLTGRGRPELLICQLNFAMHTLISSTEHPAKVTDFKIWNLKPRQNEIIKPIAKTSVLLKKSHVWVEAERSVKFRVDQ